MALRRLLVILGLALAAPSAAHPCDTLDSWARTTVARDRLPGLAYGVVKDGRILCTKGLGVTRIGGPAVTPGTNFHLASVSKAMVATAIQRLVAEGRIDLDQPIARYLPGFGGTGPQAAITVRQALTHRSGMGDVTDYHWGDPSNGDTALHDYAMLAGQAPLIAKPGAEHHYSNIAYDVLGAVIAKVSGTSFEEAMTRLLFAPAGMTRTSFLYPPANPERSTPHVRDEVGRIREARAYPFNREHGPSSTLNSNVEDMLKLASAILARDSRIMPARNWETLFTPDPAVIFPDAKDELTASSRMALGWFTFRAGPRLIVHHPGQDTGFRALLMLDPAGKAGVVLMTNSDWDEGSETPDPYLGITPAVETLLGLAN